MPRHFVQFLHANRSPSIFGQLFFAYAYAEGWAPYAEQMMWDAGYSNGDPAVHTRQLSNALSPDCPFLSAMRLHPKGIPQAQYGQKEVRATCRERRGQSD